MTRCSLLYVENDDIYSYMLSICYVFIHIYEYIYIYYIDLYDIENILYRLSYIEYDLFK